MKANLNHCLDLIGIAEAGYSNHPDDPGGPTNHGITRQTLEAWRKRYVSIQEVKDLTKEEAREILTSQYATPIRFDDLPLGLDYCVMDCSVNSGPSRAARILQEVLGMSEIDGIIGAHTLAVVAEENPPTLIDDYCTQRLAFMKTLKNWGTFKTGSTYTATGGCRPYTLRITA
jgi:lysozyme family protein